MLLGRGPFLKCLARLLAALTTPGSMPPGPAPQKVLSKPIIGKGMVEPAPGGSLLGVGLGLLPGNPAEGLCLREAGHRGARVAWTSCDRGRWQAPTSRRHQVPGSQGPKRTVEQKGMVRKWTLRGSWWLPLGVGSGLQFLNFCFSEFSTLKILVVSKIIVKGCFYEHQQPAGPKRVLGPLSLPMAGHPEGIEHGVGLGGQ